MNFPAEWSGFGPCLLALKERERKFVWAYHWIALSEGRPNGAQAARDAGYSDHKEACKVRAHLLLQREDVLDALNEVGGRELRGLVLPAVMALSRILAKDGHPDQKSTALAVLDRNGHGAKTSVDVNINGTVVVDHKTAAVEDLRRLIALGASDEKLVEVFGHSGLERYRKMLGNDPKLIEHE